MYWALIYQNIVKLTHKYNTNRFIKSDGSLFGRNKTKKCEKHKIEDFSMNNGPINMKYAPNERAWWVLSNRTKKLQKRRFLTPQTCSNMFLTHFSYFCSKNPRVFKYPRSRGSGRLKNRLFAIRRGKKYLATSGNYRKSYEPVFVLRKPLDGLPHSQDQPWLQGKEEL